MKIQKKALEKQVIGRFQVINNTSKGSSKLKTCVKDFFFIFFFATVKVAE